MTKSISAHRWYKNLRFYQYEFDAATDAKIEKAARWTSSLTKGKSLLHNVDCDDLRFATVRNYAEFLRVLGTDRFCSHIGHLFNLNKGVQIDSYTNFTDLCNRTDGTGLDLSTLNKSQALNLLEGFSAVLYEAGYDAAPIE